MAHKFWHGKCFPNVILLTEVKPVFLPNTTSLSSTTFLMANCKRRLKTTIYDTKTKQHYSLIKMCCHNWWHICKLADTSVACHTTATMTLTSLLTYRFECIMHHSTLHFHILIQKWMHFCTQNITLLGQKYAIWDTPLDICSHVALSLWCVKLTT